MKRTKKVLFFLVAALLLTVLPVCAEHNVPNETEAVYTASVSAPVSELHPGDTVYVTVSLSQPVSVYGAELLLSYDTDILAEPKAALTRTETETVREATQQMTEGELLYACTHLGKKSPAALQQNAVTVTFTAKKSGSAAVSPKRLKIVQEDMSYQIFDLTGQTVTVLITERTGQPTEPPRGGGGGGGGCGSIRGGITVSGGNAAAAQPPAPTQIPEEPAPTSAAAFSDLGQVSWAEKAITKMAETGIIKGKSEGVFAPLDALTRAEAAKLLCEAFSLTEGEEEGKTFSDVDAAAWYAEYIRCAAQNGVILGDENNRFYPEETVKREEFAAMLMRTLQAKQITLSPVRLNINFADEGEISDFAVGAVDFLYTAGIFEGDNGSFYPQSPLNRAEAAVSVYRIRSLTESGGESHEN